MLDICRRTGALWLLTPHGLPTDDPYDEAFRVAQLQLESEEAAFGTAALLAAAGFPRSWPGPFGATHRNASRRTSLTESIVLTLTLTLTVTVTLTLILTLALTSRRTSLTESIASFRNLRAPLLRAALAEVQGLLALGGTRRDQLLVDFARWRHQIPSLHLPVRLRARILHDGYRNRYV